MSGITCPSCNSPGPEARNVSDFCLFKCQSCSLVFKEDSLDTFESLAAIERWSRRHDFAPYARHVADLLQISSRLAVAELGAGAGDFAEVFKGYANSYDVYDAVDFGLPGIQYFKTDFSSKNFSLCRSYDLVIALDVLEHVSDPILFFSKIRESLSEEGRIIVETGCGDLVWGGWMNWYLNDPTHKIFLTKKSVEYIAMKVGLEIVCFKKTIHKSAYFFRLLHLVQFALSLLPKNVVRVASFGRLDGTWNPFVKNHLFMILRAKSD